MLSDAVAPSLTAVDADHARSEPARSILIRRVAVLGAGAMGARIAAHLANAGVPVVLLDIPAPDAPAGDRAARNAVVRQAVDGLAKAKPPSFFDPSLSCLLTVGNFEDDLELIAGCDWIIEAVTENLEIKRELLGEVDRARRRDAIVSTNTSGLPVSQIAERMPGDFRRNWLGTHFFNPPRYLRLVEIIPTPETDPAVIAAIEWFADRRLGKTVVRAKDTPNFIANRVGTFVLMNAMRVMQSMDLTGCKEMTLRALDRAASGRDGGGAESIELMQTLRQYFETLAMAKVSASAVEARRFGYLSPSDGITMNRMRLITEAKAKAREMADAAYAAPVPRADLAAPGENLLASLRMGVHMMRKAEYISDHDARLANSLAYVLRGGSNTPGTPMSEQYLLDLEREVFLSLCGEKKTQERIAFMLRNGKPLRN